MAKSAAGKMADYRKRQRERGLRLFQRWVPDSRNPKVEDELREAARILRTHPSTAEGDAFVEAALADLEDDIERAESRQD